VSHVSSHVQIHRTYLSGKVVHNGLALLVTVQMLITRYIGDLLFCKVRNRHGIVSGSNIYILKFLFYCGYIWIKGYFEDLNGENMCRGFSFSSNDN
jgi:hypothetical protein